MSIKELKAEFNTIRARLDHLWERKKVLLEELLFCCEDPETDRAKKIVMELDELRKKSDIDIAAMERISNILFDMLSKIDKKQSAQNID